MEKHIHKSETLHMASIAIIDTAVVEPSPIVSQPLSTSDIDLAYESDISEDLSFNSTHIKEPAQRSEKGKLIKRKKVRVLIFFLAVYYIYDVE